MSRRIFSTTWCATSWTALMPTTSLDSTVAVRGGRWARLSCSTRVAGVYVVMTAEDQRREGIGTALTGAALEAGRERGLSVGTLQVSPFGFPVYEHLGFETVTAYELFRTSSKLLDEPSENGKGK
ncbi:GNAT family N-acetyltransferase [Streptomyces sp. NPDC059460]|uniref:GNAT family N-acetyltransferase n=1 Tax=Streptomyces sp. NPDC059460 TaxID=3346840 RepID=UPI0036C2FE89